MSQRLDLTGKVFGRLTVKECLGKIGKYIWWKCLCECGNEKEVTTTVLRSGRSNSCGCLRKEITARTKTKHGALRNRKQTPEYMSYIQAMMRCVNPRNKRYHRYGQRGIKFLFNSFSEFYECLGDRPGDEYSLDRINNDGHYEPGNVRWATRVEQANNKQNNKIRRPDVNSKLFTEM